MKALIAAALLALATAGPAWANCSFPKSPERIPDGNTATLEEMQETQKAVKQFDTDVGAYQNCLEAEHKTAMDKDSATLSEVQKKDRERILNQKIGAAGAEVESVANRFNEQVRVYREKTKKK